MKKLYGTASLLFMLITTVFSQARVTETTKEFLGNLQPSYTLELPYAPATTSVALKNYLNTASSSKPGVKRGVYKYSGVNIPSISAEKIDLYATVERKSRKQKNESVVSLYVSKGYDNFISSGSDAVVASSTSRFLEAFQQEATAYQQTLALENQSVVIRKEENKVKELEKKLEKLEKELARTRNDLLEQQRLLDKQRSVLTNMNGSGQ